MSLPPAVKIPAAVAQAAAEAQAEAKQLTKDIKDARLAQEQIQEAKAAVEGVTTDAGAAAALTAVQQELANLQAAPRPNPRDIGKAQAKIAELQKLAADFSKKADIVQDLGQQAAAKAAEIARLDAERVAEDVKAKAVDSLKAFERDRSKDNIRKIETDLAGLREKLRDFKSSPLNAIAPCGDQYDKYIDDLQKEVDDRAHKAPCHVCNTLNAIPRTDAAKQALFAKMAAMKALAAKADEVGLTAAQKADRFLGQSIQALQGYAPAPAGKMIGALICRDPKTGAEKILYGFSGVIYDQQPQLQDAQGKAEQLAKAATDRVNALRAAADPTKAAELAAAETDALLKTQELAALNAQVNTKIQDAQALIGNNWAPNLPLNGGAMKSKGGAEQTMAALDLVRTASPGANNHVGVCSAPKMIQEAYAQGLEVIAMAEGWMGGGSNTDGELVVSCATCMTNIGFQLCEVCKK